MYLDSSSEDLLDAIRQQYRYSPDTGSIYTRGGWERPSYRLQSHGRTMTVRLKRGDDCHFIQTGAIAYFLMTGEWHPDRIVHRDGDVQNDCWYNLALQVDDETVTKPIVGVSATAQFGSIVMWYEDEPIPPPCLGDVGIIRMYDYAPSGDPPSPKLQATIGERLRALSDLKRIELPDRPRITSLWDRSKRSRLRLL